MNEKTKPLAALLAVSLIYACLGIPIRILSTRFTLFQQLYLWLFVAAFFSLIFFRNKIRFSTLGKISAGDKVITIFRALCYYVVGYFLWSFGIKTGKYSNIAIINILPVMTVLGVILLREKINRIKLLAILLSLIGAASVVVKEFSFSFELGIGELSALASLIFFGLSQVARKWQTRQLDNYQSTMLILGVAGVINLILSFAFGERLSMAEWDITVVSALISMGLMNVLMLFFLNFALEKIEIVVGSIILSMEMVFGIIVSIILYGEIPTIREGIGGLLVIVSVVLIRRTEVKKNKELI